jgi:multicomponent Na+:H+ antiporter subunit D
MTKIWGEVFWKKLPDATPLIINGQAQLFRIKWLMVLPVVLLTVLILSMGLWAGPFVDYSMRVAEQLLDSEGYINAVFNSP